MANHFSQRRREDRGSTLRYAWADRPGAFRGDAASRLALSTIRRWQGAEAQVRPIPIPRHVLILEDNLIIAMEAEDILQTLGVYDTHIASNLAQATTLLETEVLDFALLDVNLGEAMSFDFARLLLARHIPFGFSSGYPDSTGFPEDLRHIPLLRKPFGAEAVHRLLAEVL